MSPRLTTVVLDIYRRLTTPFRVCYGRWLIARARVPVIVFYYHRVADSDPTAWSLTNRQFARQMRWLSRRFEMISMEEAQRRIRSGENRRPAVHVTFDDGYAENCDEALPLLLRARIPCTYFVTLENVRHGRPFRHDVALGKRFPVNTIPQLRELAAAGIEIGAHTRTHPDLGPMRDPSRLFDEVVTAREELQHLVGCPIRYFAFPFGMLQHLNKQVFRLAREAGCAGVCSAYGGYNFPGGDAFHIRRVHGDPELARIRNVATLDPRHLMRPGFDYEDTPCSSDALLPSAVRKTAAL